jgi:predicted lipoprotein
MVTRRQRIAFLWITLVLALAALARFAPLFHIRPLQSARHQNAGAVFNAAAFVEKFWNERLLKSSDKAVDAAALLAEIKQDPKAARARHGRSVGLSRTFYFFVASQGRVLRAEKNAILLTVAGGSTPDVALQTGPVFGNCVRDGTGLLDVNDYPNSQDFNDISAEVNRRIEERVLPGLRLRVATGAKLRFAGCAEITEEDAPDAVLRVVPFQAEIQ